MSASFSKVVQDMDFSAIDMDEKINFLYNTSDNLSKDVSSLISSTAQLSVQSDNSVEETNTDVTQRYLLNKSKHFYDIVQPPFDQKPLSHAQRLQNLMDSMKLSLSKSHSFSELSNPLENNLNDHRLPECLQYLGLATSHSINNKAERNLEDNFQFAKPKIYDCGYCNARYLHVTAYLRHIRQHKDILRCNRCNKSFQHIIYKRRHQIRCQHQTY